MPVSNPSYFPDQRGNGSVVGITAGQLSTSSNSFLAGNNAGRASTANNLIIIGVNAGSGGITDANLAGSVIIGEGSAPLVTVGAGNPFPLVIIGGNNLTQFNEDIDSTVIIGSSILNGVTLGNPGDNIIRSVFLGMDLFPAATISPLLSGAVIIGALIGTGASAGTVSIPIDTVMVGSSLFVNAAPSQYSASVIIGSSIDGVSSGHLFGPTVAIGSAMTLPTGSGNVLLGASLAYTGPDSGSNNNVIIGEGAAFAGSSNVAIGSLATIPDIAGDAALGFVCIGYGAGATIPASGGALNGLLVIESKLDASIHTLLYGAFATGNLILGASVQGANRDLEGTNTVKLLNGTVGGADPVGGGYFYVAAGVLHWVDSSGNDTTLSVPAAPTTGSSVALFGASAANKPGATTGAGPVAWENRVIDGVSYQSPLWAT